MKTDWHDLIQRHMAGTTTAQEATALGEALHADAGLRVLYLDYMNLEVALEEAAGAATGMGIKPLKPGTLPQPAPGRSFHLWRWAAAAACAALILLTMPPGDRGSPPPRPDAEVTISSARQAIARLSLKPAPALPAWMSPTASMLEQPRLPQ
ncbi:MAG: hypothetical protein JWM59_1656 [Verrucomicrobiales bacterium]|nr:hypothetical protein [Verrucomicrobiales bacterium]